MTTPNRWLLGALILVAGALSVARPGLGQEDESAPASEPERPPVQAERYRLTVTNIDLWGARIEVTDLWFPDDGIVCNATDEYGRTHQMHAVYGKPRDLLGAIPLPGDTGLEVPESPPREKVEVPREIYERIKALADLSRRADRLSTGLAADEAVRGLFAGED